jgi:hypothetical protein
LIASDAEKVSPRARWEKHGLPVLTGEGILRDSYGAQDAQENKRVV